MFYGICCFCSGDTSAVEGYCDIDFVEISQLSTFTEDAYLIAKISFGLTVFFVQTNPHNSKNKNKSASHMMKYASDGIKSYWIFLASSNLMTNYNIESNVLQSHGSKINMWMIKYGA